MPAGKSIVENWRMFVEAIGLRMVWVGGVADGSIVDEGSTMSGFETTGGYGRK